MKTKKRALTVRVREDICEELESFCEYYDITINAACAFLIRKALEREVLEREAAAAALSREKEDTSIHTASKSQSRYEDEDEDDDSFYFRRSDVAWRYAHDDDY